MDSRPCSIFSAETDSDRFGRGCAGGNAQRVAAAQVTLTQMVVSPQVAHYNPQTGLWQRWADLRHRRRDCIVAALPGTRPKKVLKFRLDAKEKAKKIL